MTGLFMTRPVALRNEPMSRGCRRKIRGSKARWRHAPWQLRERKNRKEFREFKNVNETIFFYPIPSAQSCHNNALERIPHRVHHVTQSTRSSLCSPLISVSNYRLLN